ncbi:hypothetical protein [Phytohabitans aurantiacus]|uniref:hypothetical protein n=1 Tax=Phytohabitans aurantiacus TaxID=3016789 RepID=UPI0024918571|nr:hypothetical protein [Phytohabitans aurantiacus]
MFDDPLRRAVVACTAVALMDGGVEQWWREPALLVGWVHTAVPADLVGADDLVLLASVVAAVRRLGGGRIPRADERLNVVWGRLGVEGGLVEQGRRDRRPAW